MTLVQVNQELLNLGSETSGTLTKGEATHRQYLVAEKQRLEMEEIHAEE